MELIINSMFTRLKSVISIFLILSLVVLTYICSILTRSIMRVDEDYWFGWGNGAVVWGKSPDLLASRWLTLTDNDVAPLSRIIWGHVSLTLGSSSLVVMPLWPVGLTASIGLLICWKFWKNWRHTRDGRECVRCGYPLIGLCESKAGKLICPECGESQNRT